MHLTLGKIKAGVLPSAIPFLEQHVSSNLHPWTEALPFGIFLTWYPARVRSIGKLFYMIRVERNHSLRECVQKTAVKAVQ